MPLELMGFYFLFIFFFSWDIREIVPFFCVLTMADLTKT